MDLAGKYLPAFRRVDGGFQPTKEWQKVKNIMQSNTDVPVNVQAAPSVVTDISGKGIWGSGGGVYYPDSGAAYIDPLSGSVTTAAHEAAHQAFGSKLINDPRARAKGFESLNMNFSPRLVNDGTALRVGYETISKPIMLEEANAQGVASAAMNAAGFKPDTSGWSNMLSYPGEYRFGGRYDRAAPLYQKAFNKPGVATFMTGELDTLQTMRNSYPYALQRQFESGYGRIR